jgi:acetoin utilization protein AcuC
MAIVYHKGIVKYDFGEGHPFRGERFPRYMDIIDSHGLLGEGGMILFEPEPATDEDLAMVHTQEYIVRVMRLAENYRMLTGDTPLNPSIVEAARLIVGSGIKSANLIMGGRYNLIDSVGGGLHHAGPNYGGGFCVFNDVALCSKTLLKHGEIERILIYDTDAHAGNGTMDIFYGDPRVMFVSIHQNPRTIYPGTGFIDQIGIGEGEGYTINIPLPLGSGDNCMDLVTERVFKPIAHQFRPQVIIRNGGPDPHFQDGLASLRFTYQGFWRMGKRITEIAKEINSPIINMSCSGYNPKTVAKGMFSILAGLLEMELDFQENRKPSGDKLQKEETNKRIDQLADKLERYWKLG